MNVHELREACAKGPLVDESGACIFWVGAEAHGYGSMRYQGRTISAHRYVWLMAGRDLPHGYNVHHDCENRGCLNLLHLRLLKHGEHTKLHHPRQATCSRCGSADWVVSTDGRTCRPCKREYMRKYLRDRYHSDDKYREHLLARQAKWKREDARRKREKIKERNP